MVQNKGLQYERVRTVYVLMLGVGAWTQCVVFHTSPVSTMRRLAKATYSDQGNASCNVTRCDVTAFNSLCQTGISQSFTSFSRSNTEVKTALMVEQRQTSLWSFGKLLSVPDSEALDHQMECRDNEDRQESRRHHCHSCCFLACIFMVFLFVFPMHL